jgi:photosystem II stability/assembly factor-like uncharacterized protein
MNISRSLVGASLLLVLFGAGCTLGTSKPAQPTGGMWYSPDRGTSWKQTAVLYTSSGVADWSNVDVVATTIDPEDTNAMYVGTRDNGMFYTYDSGKTWMQPADMSVGAVQAIAVSPKEKCTIVAGKLSEIWMSNDCSRTYKRIFTPEINASDFLKSVVIDWYNPSMMYALSKEGVFFKSMNGGATWKSPIKFAATATQLVIDPHDSRILFAGLDGNGLRKSIDGGETWVNLKENAKMIEGSGNVKVIATAMSKADEYVVATVSGLMRTMDGGITWEPISLLTIPAIVSLSIDPTNANIIYYGTDKVFYRTANGGLNWETIKLPTARAAGTLLVHPGNPASIYMGAKNLAK